MQGFRSLALFYLDGVSPLFLGSQLRGSNTLDFLFFCLIQLVYPGYYKEGFKIQFLKISFLTPFHLVYLQFL